MWVQCTSLFFNPIFCFMFYPATISSLVKMTEQSVDMELQPDPGTPGSFYFQAGQYLTLRIPSLDRSAHRSYSLSSAPYENKLRIGIKKVERGLVSSYLCRQAKVGDRLEIMSPQGNFILPDHNQPLRLVVFASGSGITPIMAMIKQEFHLQNESKTILFYGNKNDQSRMYQEELNSLSMNHPGQLEILHIYSKQKASSEELEGRIDEEKLSRWKLNLFNIHDTDYFLLCGPGTMVSHLEQALKTYSIPPSKILTEYFSAPKSPPLPPEINTTPIPSSGHNIRIKFENKIHQLNVKNNKDVVLDQGIKYGLDLPYSCKSGVCATCQARLLSGEVRMDNNYVLGDSELKQGYILTCQSHVLSPEISVDYDAR